MSGRTQLTLPHCSWASLPNNLPRPILSEHSCAINCQMFFLKRENFHDQISTKKNAGRMVDLGSDCNKKSFTNSLLTGLTRQFFLLLHVLGIYMCTELVPILHTREGTLYRTKRIHFFIDFSSAQPATVLGDPDFSITVHNFGKMQNTSPTGLLGEKSNIDVF